MTIRRSSLLTLAALAPLAALACGGERKPASPTSAPSATVTTEQGAITSPRTVKGTPATETIAVANANASYADGEAAFRAGKYHDASAIFGAYASRRPENVWGHYMRGLSAWKAGDLATAEEAFDRALSVDSTHLKSLVNSSRVLLERGRTREALERAEQAIAVDSTNGDALRLVGRAHDELGNAEQAIEAYRAAIVLNDRDVWAMNNLGLVYLEQGRAEDALPPLARAVELRSTAPVFQNNLGIALERTGHLVEAQKAFEAAVVADSSYGKASVSLARVQGRDQTGSTPADLGALAQDFVIQIRQWRDSIQPARDSVADDSVQVQPAVGDSVK